MSQEIFQPTYFSDEHQLLHQLFEKIATQLPDKIAIIHDTQHISYHFLNERANHLAHYIYSLGVMTETRIGIALPRGIDLIIGLLAVLKVGAAYVPLDIDYPKDRISYMLEDSQVKLVLSLKGIEFSDTYQERIVCLDEKKIYLNQSSDNLCIPLFSGNLAYVTYTSGSTGRPKGVTCHHAGVMNRLYWGWSHYSFKKDETCCLQSSIAFVDSTWDIFGTLLAGGRLVLYKEATSKNIEELLEVCFLHKITRITLIPSFLKTVLDFGGNKLQAIKKYLTHWEITGESFTPDLLVHFFKHMGKTSKILDCYGATEATSVVYRDYIKENVYQTKILENTEVYLLDSDLSLVSIGMEGEIYIGGVGLARGYINQPGLTAEKFIPNPFKEGSRLYKTGDLGRYLVDGNIEFLGRIDHQLKLRGFRIELGEIEQTIASLEVVQQVVVVCREDSGQKRLVAYVVSKNKEEQELLASLQTICQERLPEYMQPSQWVVLETMPLTPNGKIDRKGLPAPKGRAGIGGYQSPQGHIEEQLAMVWSELLGLPVGRNDDFFRLGGHSLLATQMVSRLREVLKLEVSLKAVFEHKILCDLARYLEEFSPQKNILPAIKRVAHDKPQALSFAQQRLWFIEQLLPNTGLYHNAIRLKISGPLNTAALRQALDAMVVRHEILRTVISNIDGVALQSILSKDIGFPLQESEEEDKNFTNKPFDFERQSVCRGLLINHSHQKHTLLLVFHHMVTDDWSMGIFCKELNIFYKAYVNNTTPTLHLLPVRYIDYSVWQRNWLQGAVLDKQLQYWQSHLKEVARLELPTDYPRPSELSYAGGSVKRKLSKELSEKLYTFSQERNVTLFMSLLASIQGFLGRYCNQNDVAIGTPIANRRAIETEGLIGFFVNTLVLRETLEAHLTFDSLINKVKNNTLAAYEHQDVPFEQLVEHLQVPRELNRNPLFQVMFTLHPAAESFKLGDLNIELEEMTDDLSRFDLLINAFINQEGLQLQFDYAKDLFSQESIERFANCYENFLTNLLYDPNQRLSEIPLLSQDELQQLFVWNNTKQDISNNSIHTLFEEQAEKTPLNIALVYEAQEISYQTLNGKSNQLARYLRAKGVGPDKLVAISMERSIELIIGLLAILKAGGAYVPFDASYPEERLIFLLEDTKAPLLITQERFKSVYDGYNKLIFIETEWAEIEKLSKENLQSLTLPQHLAYIIYTSGSTGKPKGVMVQHQNLTHYITYACKAYPLKPGTSLFHGSYSFDMSITSIFLPLVQGHAIGIVPEKVDVGTLGAFIRAQQDLNLIKVTPTHLKVLKDQLSISDIQQQQATIIVGGENLVGEDVAYWQEASPNSSIINEYGPTETTVGCCVYPLANNKLTVPIGRPIDNTEIYILDKALQVVPIGTVGEIYIGGKGLARGYLERPGLTAVQFIPNPFGNGSRLYKTGDLARYLKNGNLEFLGRCDDQVKVRGYRIELGEIQVALSRHQDVSQSTVIVKEDEHGIKKLVAYIVPGEFTPSPTEIKEYLDNLLPHYMVPSTFIYIDKIPLTLNGKLDHKVLLELGANSQSLENEYTAPRNEKEKVLSEIWSAVLGIEKISIKDHFFRIGGDSIVSIQLVSKGRQQGIYFSVKDVFNHPTIEELATVIQEKEALGAVDNKKNLVKDKEKLNSLRNNSHFKALFEKISQQKFFSKITIEDIYPLSPLQAGLLFQSLYEPNSEAYFVQSVFKLEGNINQELLKNSWQKVCDLHAILRTGFIWEDLEKPLQYVASKIVVPFEFEKWHNIKQSDKESSLMAYTLSDRQQGFKLDKAPLFRIKLIECNDNTFYMIWSSHHILLDGWSTPLILRDVLKAYEGLVKGEEIKFNDYLPYKDYITWLEQQDKVKAKTYWKETLHSIDEPTRLSFKRIVQKDSCFQDYATHEVELSVQETKSIQGYARMQGVTLNTVLQGAVGILLQHYTQKNEVIMGVTVSGRVIDLIGIEDMVGLFINTLPLKINCQIENTMTNYLKYLQEQTQQLNEFSYTSLSEIYGWTNHHEGLFDVLFVFENYPTIKSLNRNNQSFEIANIHAFERTEYPLTIIVLLGEKIRFIFRYKTEHFDNNLMTKITNHLKTLFQNMQKNDKKPVLLPYLSNQEYYQIVEQWNETKIAYPQHKTIHALFEEQVEKTPSNIALVFENETITYQELNHKANQLAYFLRENGIGPDKLVAISVSRSIEMLVALLGILKAGGTYVPFDPSYPEERLIFMLVDTASPFLITQESFRETFSGYNKIFFIDTDWMKVQKKSINNPKSLTFSQNLAYIIYTSGSTGKPKGVMVSHGGLINRFLWMKDKYNLTMHDRFLQKTPFTFDVSVWEIFIPLLVGATEIIASPGSHKEPHLISEVITKQKVSICHFVPPMLTAFLEAKESFEKNNLRLVITSGDALSQETVEKFHEKINARLDNLYGPTEASIEVTFYSCLQKDGFIPPIGRPIWNTQMYVLDLQLNPVPVGVSGGIYIGGVGLARGYFNRPALTAEKFIPNPFNHTAQDKQNTRLYSTGDLGRYLPDGNIEFLGRGDDQVKLRGYRIELGEVEATIANHVKISQVLVIARKNDLGIVRLIAYIVPKVKEENTLIEELRKYVESILPDYMVPSFFVCLSNIPITHNGKIDRTALPNPEITTRPLENLHALPRNEQEKKLSEIWSAVLGITQIGIKENFFRIGGDSIVSIQLVSKARQQGLIFSVKDIFNYPTIEKLAVIAQEIDKSKNIIDQDSISGEVSLTPIQHWFFLKNPTNPHHYNQVMWLKNKELIDLDRLQSALNTLYQHHDGFRLRYKKESEVWTQYYVEESISLPWKVYENIADEDVATLCTEVQAGLNIEKGPLSQVVWFAKQKQLLWVIHHLIVDGVSWRILLEDLNLTYNGVPLDFKSDSFKNWSQSLSLYTVTTEAEYYKKELNNIPRLVSDYDYSGYIALKDTQELSIYFSLETTKLFLQKVHQAYGTQPNDLLLLALVQATGDCFGKYSLCVDLEGHGREDLGGNLDLTHTLGWFTSMHPLILTIKDPTNLDESIKYIKEYLRHIPHKGVGYGILTRIQNIFPFIQGDILFNYLGQWSNIEQQDSMFFFEEGNTGLSASLENPHTHPIIINGSIREGQLSFDWSYSKLHYNTKTIYNFSQKFKERLEKLIEYCTQQKNFGYTPSDFPHVKLQAKQLDKLLKKIRSENNV